jgi:hypothetical protein
LSSPIGNANAKDAIETESFPRAGRVLALFLRNIARKRKGIGVARGAPGLPADVLFFLDEEGFLPLSGNGALQKLFHNDFRIALAAALSASNKPNTMPGRA